MSPGGQVTLAPGAPTLYGVQLDHGWRDVPAVEEAFVNASRPGAAFVFNATSRVVTEVELALKPESVAFGAFGVIAGLVALLIGVQAISRQLRWDDEDRQVLRTLGAAPALAAGDGLVGALAAVVLGSLLAAAVAVGLSPLAPLGPVRQVYPDGGIAFDWTVLGHGRGRARRRARSGRRRARLREGTPPRRPEHEAGGGSHVRPGPRRAVGGDAGSRRGRGAFRPRTGTGTHLGARPLRVVGTVVAVAVVVSALTFAASLSTLVSHPPLYGWNWDYMFDTTNDVPPQSLRALDHDHDVAAWSGADLVPFQIDGQFVPSLVASPHARVAPPVLSGHGLDANDEIVMGSATLARTAQARRRHRLPQRGDP